MKRSINSLSLIRNSRSQLAIYKSLSDNKYISIPSNATATTTTITTIPHEYKQKYTPSCAITGSAFSVRAFHSNIISHSESVIPFNLADIGEGIMEVEVLEWFIEEGQTINQFDKVAQVQSDKASVEITSRYDGVVKKLHYGVGDMAQVGAPLIDISVKGVAGDTATAAVPKEKDEVAETAVPKQETGSNRSQVESSFKKVLTTPAVRHLARQNGIDLTRVPATGKNGRVLKEDVLNFLKGGEVSTVQTPATVTPVATAAAATHTVPLTAGKEEEGDRVEPVRGIMRAMIKSMTASTQIPHLGLSDEVQMDNLMALREQIKSLSTEERLTFMPFFIKAASLALEQYPILNAQLSGDQTQIIYKTGHNIGIAMDTPQGLLVPNIKNVNKLSVFEIAKELNRLIVLGKEGRLGQEELKGGTFTLSNIGTIGGTYASPILTSPEVGIGAIGKTQKLPRYNEKGEVEPVSIMYISWSADHRIIDGATIARFSNLWKDLIENPLRILYGN